MKQKLLNSLRLQLCTLVACLLCAFNGQAWGQTFQKITSVNDLEYGARYIIVYEESNAALGGISSTSTKYGLSIAVTIANNAITITNEKVNILTLGGSKTNGWTFATSLSSGKSLTWTSGNSLNIADTGKAFTISFSEGNATISFMNGNETRYLKYNTSSPRFACYNTDGTVQLYKEVSSSATATTTSIDATGITNRDVYTSPAAGSLSASVTADGTAVEGATVTWSSSNTNVATIDANGAVTLVAAGTTTITASYAGVTDQYQASSATYELTVTDSSPTEILDYTSLNLANGADLGTQNATNFSAVAAKGSNSSNGPKYYTSDNTARFYAGNTLTISSTTNKKIAKIEFNVNVNATVNTGSLTNNIWIGSATTVVFTMPKVSIKTIKVTFENENLNDPELSFPTTAFEVEAGATFTAPTLTNPHSLQVTYSSSNADIATVNETTGAVTIGNTPGTVTITATFEGNDVYSFGSASYTITVSTVLSNIAALTALEEDGEYQVNLTDALVTYIHGKNVYLEDASGAVLLYDCAEGLAVGDKINGTADVTYTVYHSLPEVTAITLHEGYTKTSGNTVTPSEVTIAELNENFTSYISRYVKIVEATVTSAFDNRSAEITQGEASIDLRDQNSTATLTATVDDIVTVTAHPAIYNTTKQIAVYEQSQIVVKEVEKIDPTILVEDASIAFGSSYTIDTELIEGGEINVTSGNTSIATVNGLTITPIAVGSVEITVNTAESNQYNAGSETFTLTVTQPAGQTMAPTATTGEVMFYEPFTSCEGSGGNDDVWSGSIAAKEFTSDNEGWTHVKGSSANECAKFGAGSSKGSATTPTIAFNDANATYTLTFKAGAWSGDKTEDALTLSCSDANATLSTSTFSLSDGAWSNFSVTITGVSSSATLTFSAVQASKNRFFLDEVKIEAPSSAVPTESYEIPSSGLGTYCSKYPIDLTKLPEGVKVYAVESHDGNKATLAEITDDNIKGGVGFIIEGEGNKTVEFSFTDSENEPENELVGTLAPTYLELHTAYGLKGGKFQPNSAGTMRANRAYLPNTTNGVKALVLEFRDSTTGITHTRTLTNEEAEQIFNIAGQRMNEMQKGINIVGGKKVLVK